MLRLRIYLTVFVLYEIIAVTVLHMSRTCDALFGGMFCMDHVFKYFIVCFAVPMIVFLLAMWIMHIIDRARYRHSLMYKAKTAVKEIARNIGDHVSETVSTKDVEKMIIGALLVGVKKYAAAHPNTRRAFGNLIDMVDNGEYGTAEYNADADDDNDMPSSAPRKRTRTAASRQTSKTKKTK